MWWVLLALCGCNQVFGLKHAIDRDAPEIVPPDAQPYCPPTGTLPRFSPNIFQLFDADCFDYTLSTPANRAMAICSGLISDGPPEGLLAAHHELPSTDAKQTLLDARLDADGTVAYVTVFNVAAAKRVYETWQHTDSGYVRGSDLAIVGGGFASSPSRTTPRHMLYADLTNNLIEWVETAPNVWQSHSISIGAATVSAQNVWLAADGLRAVVYANEVGANFLLYIDRARVDDSFAPPVPLLSLPPVTDVFITEDCSRAYMSSVQSIFYAAQI